MMMSGGGMMGEGMMGEGMMGGGFGGFGGFGLTWLLNFAITIVFVAGLILLVVWFVRQFSGDQRLAREEKVALDILKERYAKGDINREEFEQKKKDIRA